MKSKILNINDIKPYKNNPRKNDGAVAAVKESIKQCGYIAHIIVDENNEVLAGHTRLKALKQMGKKQVEVLVYEELTDEQKRKYRVLDNKTSEFSCWDMEKLNVELEKVDFGDFDFGFDAIDESEFDINPEASEYVHKSFTLHEAQKQMIIFALAEVKNEITETFGNENKNGNALYEVVRQWAEQRK